MPHPLIGCRRKLQKSSANRESRAINKDRHSRSQLRERAAASIHGSAYTAHQCGPPPWLLPRPCGCSHDGAPASASDNAEHLQRSEFEKVEVERAVASRCTRSRITIFPLTVGR